MNCPNPVRLLLWYRRYVGFCKPVSSILGYVDNALGSMPMWTMTMEGREAEEAPGRHPTGLVMHIEKSGFMAQSEFMKELPHA